MKSFFDRYVGAFCALILICCFAGIASAQTAQTRSTPCNAQTPNDAICVNWDAPTTFENGRPITGAITYDVERQFAGGAWTAAASGISVRQLYVTNLAPGVYTFRVFASVGGQRSAASNTASREATAVPQIPSPPVLRVVQVVIGVDHAPVFTVLATGTRSATVAGFAAVGTPCEGPALFRYRNQNYHKPAAWKAWATSSGTSVAAPCA